MVSHHHRQKIRRRRLRLLKIFCIIPSILFVFFGTGEMFQGSSMMGIVLIGLAAVLIIISINIPADRKH